MKRVLLSLLIVVSILILGFSSAGGSAHASAQAPTATYTLGALLRVKLTIPYAWLRSAPASNGAVIDTAQRGEFIIVASPAPSWDGAQWWWAVRRANGSATGWIEQNSIESATAQPTSTSAATPAGPTPTSSQTPATWEPETQVILAPGVPFAWLRDDALSAANVRGTVLPGQLLFIQGGTSLPRFDGIQYWWLVRTNGISKIGWIEQKSLQQITVTPTLIPTSVPGQSAGWAAGTLLVIKSTVPYSLLRISPSSAAASRALLYPGSRLTVYNANATWDGVQWWWQVAYPSLNLFGWIEQNSLQLAPNPPTPTSAPGGNSAGWANGTIVQIRTGVPFVWVRSTPSSAGSVRDTIQPGSLMQITGAARWDGTQWWWPIRLAFASTTGWVEQNSLVTLFNVSAAATQQVGGSGEAASTVVATSEATTVATPAATAAS